MLNPNEHYMLYWVARGHFPEITHLPACFVFIVPRMLWKIVSFFSDACLDSIESFLELFYVFTHESKFTAIEPQTSVSPRGAGMPRCLFIRVADNIFHFLLLLATLQEAQPRILFRAIPSCKSFFATRSKLVPVFPSTLMSLTAFLCWHWAVKSSRSSFAQADKSSFITRSVGSSHIID